MSVVHSYLQWKRYVVVDNFYSQIFVYKYKYIQSICFQEEPSFFLEVPISSFLSQEKKKKKNTLIYAYIHKIYIYIYIYIYIVFTPAIHIKTRKFWNFDGNVGKHAEFVRYSQRLNHNCELHTATGYHTQSDVPVNEIWWLKFIKEKKKKIQ